MASQTIIGVMGAGDDARKQDTDAAFALGEAIAREGWVLLSGGRNKGVMDAVNRGAKQSGGLTVGISPGNDKTTMSSAVDVAIVTGMGSARNYINALSSDVIIACGYGGSGTASEIALALKSKRNVILFNDRPESFAYFSAIGKGLVHVTESVEATVALVRKLVAAARS